MRDKVLHILARDARASFKDIAERLGISAEEAEQTVRQLEAEGAIRGYRALVDWSRTDIERVFAFILVEASPEHGVGFENVAATVARFEEVHSVHLTSGQADLTVVVAGDDFREIARFVAEKLAPTPGVTGTATSFVLRSYKMEGVILSEAPSARRLAVSP